MEQFVTIAVPVILLAIAIRILITPIRWILKLAVHVGMGFVCLLLLNYFSGYTGIHFELSPTNCRISGLGGIPGVILLVLMQLYG